MSVIWYDKQGKPLGSSFTTTGSQSWLDNMAKIEKLLSSKYKIVKQDKTPKKKYWVSTVWLGIDHSFGWFGDEPNPHPIIFETMVFNGDRRSKNKYEDLDMVRYETEEQAIKGHKKLLAKWSRRELK